MARALPQWAARATLAAVLLSACGDGGPTEPVVVEGEGALLQVASDTLVLKLSQDGWWEGSIRGRLTNVTSAPLYSWWDWRLELGQGAGWLSAYAPIPPGWPYPPFELSPGETWEFDFQITAGTRADQAAHFERGPSTGVHSIVAGLYRVSRPMGPNYVLEDPVTHDSTRSNRFILVVVRQ